MTQEEKNIINNAIAILDKHVKENPFNISDSKDVIDYIRLKIELCEREVFGIIFLTTKHDIIAFEEMFLGTIDQSEVHPREIVKKALLLNAAAVILTHNHPSGNSKPSEADIRVTIKNALSLVDMRVLDHVLIGSGNYVSFAESGLL